MSETGFTCTWSHFPSYQVITYAEFMTLAKGAAFLLFLCGFVFCNKAFPITSISVDIFPLSVTSLLKCFWEITASRKVMAGCHSLHGKNKHTHSLTLAVPRKKDKQLSIFSSMAKFFPNTMEDNSPPR